MRKTPLLFLILSFFLTINVHSAYAADIYCITKPKANFREKPSKESQIVMTLVHSVYYPVLIEKKKGKWMLAKDFEGDGGWIIASSIENIPCVVVSDWANVRSKAGTSGKLRWKAEKGEAFKVIGSAPNWIEVEDYVGNNGWIYKPLLWGKK